ncbi:MAG: dephospho-CoA kinase [Spirochaetes bacterium]|nr:dephospho-CoA kinase [Spirochaetota bacterium]
MMTIVGLTGGYCSGKNEAAVTFAHEGFTLIDVDALGHKALAACAEKLARTFGPGILQPDGKVNRKALGEIVFSNREKLQLHESIVHPVMLRFLDEEIQAHERICIHAALLYRFPQTNLCDLIVEMKASIWLRIKRGMARDGLGIADILRRISKQRYLWKLRPKEKPPVVIIENDGNLQALEAQVKMIIASRLPS